MKSIVIMQVEKQSTIDNVSKDQRAANSNDTGQRTANKSDGEEFCRATKVKDSQQMLAKVKNSGPTMVKIKKF